VTLSELRPGNYVLLSDIIRCLLVFGSACVV